MAVRKTFKPAEKAVYVPGVAIEWRNNSHWHPGIIVNPPVKDDITGWWRMEIRHTGRKTATIAPNQRVDVLSSEVRLPQ
jgi:hypothetical protein